MPNTQKNKGNNPKGSSQMNEKNQKSGMSSQSNQGNRTSGQSTGNDQGIVAMPVTTIQAAVKATGSCIDGCLLKKGAINTHPFFINTYTFGVMISCF